MPQQKKTKTARKPAPKQNVKRVSAPSAYGAILSPPKFSISTVSEGVVRLRGHELLGAATLATTASPILGVFDLNPACWQNSRLARIASTYEKYRYDSFTVRFHPSVGTNESGSIALYIEPEAEEAVTTDVVVAMNHQYSTMGPTWSPLAVTYRRAPQDATAYYMTTTAGGERNSCTQAKAVLVSDRLVSGSFLYLKGFVSIDYDVVFMYPELETNFPGSQFTVSGATYPPAAANDVIFTTTNWISAGFKTAEIVLNQALTGVFQNLPANSFNYPIGSILYTAWDGIGWCLYTSLDAATSNSNPLKWLGVKPAGAIDYLVRTLFKQ